eukprot:scaffold68662_cov18-Tisochrysis_lutea.AAC.1
MRSKTLQLFSCDQAEYQWRCVSANCPLLGGPGAGEEYQSSVLKELTPSDLVGRVPPGAEYKFELSARMRKGQGADETVSDAVQVKQVRKQSHPLLLQQALTYSIKFIGDSIVAGFTRESPSGDVSRGREDPLVFHGTGSDPSDPSNSAQPMRWVHACNH